jgi:spore coat protein U-like protein
MFGGHRAEAATVTTTLQVGASVNLRCTIINVPLVFGGYTITNPSHHDIAGMISLNCTPSNFTMRVWMSEGLNPGSGSSNASPERRMTDGLGNMLHYNLYRDAARTQVWGGTLPTGVSMPGTGPWPMSLPVYGRIAALQNPPPGTYEDTVTVTVLF